jgi:hypothetical protein
MPSSFPARCLLTEFCGASKVGVALTTEAAMGAVAAGLESEAFACTVRVVRVITTATSATDEAPASSHTRSGVFDLVLLISRPITICLFYQFGTINSTMDKNSKVYFANDLHIMYLFR